jgi:hypothetical protein
MNKEQALERLTSLENEAKELRKIIECEEPMKPTPEERFAELISGWEWKIDFIKYPDSLFIFKDGYYLFQYDYKNGYLWVNYNKVWSFFYSEFGMKYEKVQLLVKDQVEQHFKLRVTTAGHRLSAAIDMVEQHFKLRVTTASQSNIPSSLR